MLLQRGRVEPESGGRIAACTSTRSAIGKRGVIGCRFAGNSGVIAMVGSAGVPAISRVVETITAPTSGNRAGSFSRRRTRPGGRRSPRSGRRKSAERKEGPQRIQRRRQVAKQRRRRGCCARASASGASFHHGGAPCAPAAFEHEAATGITGAAACHHPRTGGPGECIPPAGGSRVSSQPALNE